MIVDIRQRSPEWYVWRRQGITASTVAAVLGYDEHKTPWRVWAEYLGKIDPEDLSRNPHVRRGILGEDAVRQAFEDRHNEVAIPACVESDENPVFRASLDGLSLTGVPVEMKCPARSTHNEVKAYGRVSEPYLRYWPQVQHQIYTAGADHGYLCFLNESDTEEPYIEFRIERDETFIRDEMIPLVLDFWHRIQKKKEPPRDPQRDVFIPEGDDITAWLVSVESYRQAKADIDARMAEVEALKETLKALEEKLGGLMGDFRTAYAFGLQVTRFGRAGTIDYKKIVQERLPNLTDSELEAYRRAPGKPQMRITEKTTPSEEVASREAQAREQHANAVRSINAETYPLANW